MHEFTCEKCDTRVIDIVGEPHPEKVLCAQCRFIEGIDDPAEKARAEAFFARKRAEIDQALGLGESA